MRRDIIIKWFFQYPPETMWEYLTNPDLLSRWFMITNFKPDAGYTFEWHMKPKPWFDGIVYSEVKEVVPFRRLSYTFCGGPTSGIITLDTVVAWTLSPRGVGTDLLLEHTGFTGMKNYFTSLIIEAGWKKNVSRKLSGTLLQAFPS